MRDELPNPYLQAFHTYLSRAFASRVAMAFLIAGMFQIACALYMRPTIGTSGWIPYTTMTMGLGYWALLAWTHFREQILHSRRFLTPGFLVPHVVVFAIITCVIVVLIPGLIILRNGLESVGLIVIAMAFFAMLGWGIVTLRILPSLSAYLLIMLPMLQDSIWHIARGFIFGQHEPVAIALLLCAVLAMIIPIVRLCRLTEADPSYGKQILFDTWNVRARVTGETNRIWQSQPVLDRLDCLRRSLAYRPVPIGASLWTRARRWPSLGGGANSLMMIAVVDCAVLVPILILSKGLSFTGTSSLVTGFLMVMIYPPALISQEWLQRWRFLEADTLRPISREDFLKEMAMAIAQRYLQAWGITAALILVVLQFIVTMPHPLRTWAYFALVSFGIGVSGWGMSVSLLRYRSPGILMLLGLPLAPFAVAATWVILQAKTSYANIALAGIAILAAVGLWIARDAYHRWLVTELG